MIRCEYTIPAHEAHVEGNLQNSGYHFCPEMHTVTKLVNLTKFRPTEWMLVKSDPRSKISNLSNWKEEAWKISI